MSTLYGSSVYTLGKIVCATTQSLLELLSAALMHKQQRKPDKPKETKGCSQRVAPNPQKTKKTKKTKDLIQISLDLTEVSYSYTRPSMSDRAHLCQIFGFFGIFWFCEGFELLSESTLQFLLVFLVFSMACASSQAVARQLVQEPGSRQPGGFYMALVW